MTSDNSKTDPAAAAGTPCTAPVDSPCEDALHEIYEYLDGEMTDERRALIARHLDDCSPCLEAFDFENELRLLIARRCREEAPEGLRRRIAEAIAGCEDEPAGDVEH